MHFESNTVHATREELLGLIRTAQEILPELAAASLDTAGLFLEDIPTSKCRVASYRLTNCVGAYNSERTLNGVEPRWAWKDNNGGWACHTSRHRPPVCVVRSEGEARDWIAAAQPAEVVLPEDTLANIVNVESFRPRAAPAPTNEFHAFTQNRQAYLTNAPGAVRFSAARAYRRAMQGDHSAVTDLYRRFGPIRMARREGQTWVCCEFRDTGTQTRAGRYTRRRAVAFVQGN
jgi:hypothetical protein